ncbi:Rho GTPase activation protein [Chlamydoabsidia padenii]|nr:Rho GTPase activation protein [Chlamydoabsidia padenii]
MVSPISDSSSITSTSSSSSSSTSTSAFSFDGVEDKLGNNKSNTTTSSVLSKLAGTVRDTRTRVEQKKLELNASMQERLPEWRSRGVMYGNLARETSLEWSRKGKEAVDRWKKDRVDRMNESPVSEDASPYVFGQPLERAVMLTRLAEHDHIPLVVRRCIDYLDKHGIHELGIYRIPGSTLAVNKLRSTFDSGNDCDLLVIQPDANVVATLLKMYLRDLPEPIIPQELGQDYKQQITQYIHQRQVTNSNTNLTTIPDDDHITAEVFGMPRTEELPSITPELLDAVRITTTKLPITNLYLLKVLCQHLKRIANNAKENKMTTSNLALIFIPTLGIGRLLFHCMVDHYDQVFGVPDKNSLSTASSRSLLLSIPVSAGPIQTHSRSVPLSNPTTVNNKPLPPPLPLKPKHINIPKPSRRHNKSLDFGCIHQSRREHSKTLSDTDVISLITPSPPLPPPPKPPRSPITKPVLEYFRPSIDRITENKPRSRSVSFTQSPPSSSLISPTTSASTVPMKTSAIPTRGGNRVEAIGRQFEQIMVKSSPLSPSLSSSKLSNTLYH